MRKILSVILLLCLSASLMQAQVVIGGSVYGGGRQADVNQTSRVTLHGGAATDDETRTLIVINSVYGGNDVSGTVKGGATVTSDGDSLFVGQLYGGGNGDYDDETYADGKQRPVLTTTSLNLEGGTFGYVYGGGNAATVGATTITINNSSTPLNIANTDKDGDGKTVGDGDDLLTDAQLADMKINTAYFDRDGNYNFSRVFGGNNKAAMGIMPTWNLQKGSIQDLYSGGNEGPMTGAAGILLEIAATSEIKVDNVYGGCRKADVSPMDGDRHVVPSNLDGYVFPDGLSARVIIRGGDINNVYGGNDVAGKVWGGAAVGVYHSIRGDIYGGGNGSYPYTDNIDLGKTLQYNDFYYDLTTAASSVVALDNFRPTTESVSIFVKGTESQRTIIGGSIYCGGNSTTLRNDDPNQEPYSELKVGSYVTADQVFLGNNGVNLTSEALLEQLAGYVTVNGTEYDFSQINLKDEDQMATYMNAVAMDIKPRVVFYDYTPYTTRFGSLYCGGNVGSITYNGSNELSFSEKIIIFEKLVGGCNNAFVPAGTYNAEYKGGITGTPDATTGNKLVMNFNGLMIQPKRWSDASKSSLIWNTKKWQTYSDDEDKAAELVDAVAGDGTPAGDLRLAGGNIYGGCYASGYVNGNVVINIKSDLVDKDEVFGEGKSGVDRVKQYNDVLISALNVFGAGYGEQSEIRGNTTINIEGGYAFQTFGGGEKGTVSGNCTTNLKGGQVEYIYGGGMEGPVTGSVYTHLGHGQCVGVIGGACNANIGGHTEVYIGDLGFPDITEDVYGGNDFGGEISESGRSDFREKLSEFAKGKTYNGNALKSSTYVEYIQGNIGGSIFGGNYGSYDYTDALYRRYTNADGTAKSGFAKPRLKNSFVNFMPNNAEDNAVVNVYGGSQGYGGEAFNNKMQDQSYVLVDIQNAGNANFAGTQVFGAGDFAGVGLTVDKETAATNEEGVVSAAVIDLVRGQIKAAYGGSYQEGTTRRTIVNVPVGSTIQVENIFAGAYGVKNNVPCDVYEATLNYSSGDATVTGALYGGNNDYRRTLYGTVNVNSPVWSNKSSGYTATVYGAGYGANSWSRNTTVNLNEGANVYEVYGGGNAGMVLNLASEDAWKNTDATLETALDGGYDNDYLEGRYAKQNPLGVKTNTNIYINQGATVAGYAYGGGLGATATIAGTTYIGLHGGTVVKDLYAGGTSGAVEDKFGVGTATFKAETYAYIEGGLARNVYGGGWEGNVGHHAGKISDATDSDIEGDTHVVIGKLNGTSLTDGVPAILRNAYGGGEGGSVFGKAYVTMNNGYIGYRYDDTKSDNATTTKFDERYVEVLDDKEADDNELDPAGNIFGGGYVVNSFTDYSDITMWGGVVRGCLYGGGELGPIGRGSALADAPAASITNADAKIYKGGSTKIVLYNGHVMRDIFGGGRGMDNWGGDGTMYMDSLVKASLDMSVKGYVFGKTEVRIRGGEVGTVANVVKGYGNVFGGGNVGFVYSAEGQKKGVRKSQALSELTNGLPTDGGGYYYSKWIDNDRSNCELSLDCNVVVEPYCQVKAGQSITIDKTYEAGDYVPIEELNKLADKNTAKVEWEKIDYESGVTIHNAVFAGGNVIIGFDERFSNTATVFGNVTAAVRDAYHRDLITIGTEHTGGLYGDGNLTYVDGWRELHIDNFGTDYYAMESEVTKEKYLEMSDRERAYFVLNYRAKQAIYVTGTINGRLKEVKVDNGERLTSDQFKEAFAYDFYLSNETDYPAAFKEYINADGTPNPTYFEELGFCSIYAGRLLNTIQRCDMAAIWGSRIVLQGARDRVPEKADFTRYTINRVGELSLNQRKSEVNGEVPDQMSHGNYFGIYSIVNYLGNLTSDVFFTETASTDPNDPSHTAIRTSNTSNTDNDADQTTTFYTWKKDRAKKSNRNNGTSANKVSLASGVYLEIIREESETAGHTEWGLITGVVELDLIDVKTGLGGGYVYARNQHGLKEWHSDWDKVNLSPYNRTARTYKRFTYDETEANLQAIETSGNFVHNTKQIVDDCYPNTNAYKGEDKAPAHYWYIKGQIYVYDQYISAYTGAATAYHQTASIPLTISASSHGRLTLRDVQQNLYAYYGDIDDSGEHKPLGSGNVVVNGITYNAGDPIDYWTYQSLSAADREHFVPNIYTTIAECKLTKQDGEEVTYPAGSALLPDEYAELKALVPVIAHPTDTSEPKAQYVYNVEREEYATFDYLFRQANAISHNEGFVLTFDWNNPTKWDDYYTANNNSSSISKEVWEALTSGQSDYTTGPTYRPTNSGVYGQKAYQSGDIITKDIHDNQSAVEANLNQSQKSEQAISERAYVVTKELKTTTTGGIEQHLYPGSPVYRSNYAEATWTGMEGSVAEAKVCSNTIKYGNNSYVYAGTLLSQNDVDNLMADLKAANDGWTDDEATAYLKDYLSDAYIITKDGLYGGTYYNQGKVYGALGSWCTMSKADREKFVFNYDGLDLLIDPNYGTHDLKTGWKGEDYGFKPQYDGYKPGTTRSAISNGGNEPQHEGSTVLSPLRYSETMPIDFEAEFNPTVEQQGTLGSHYNAETHKLTYTGKDGQHVISQGYDNRIKSSQYNEIPNERVHWSPIIVTAPGIYYVVKEAFIRGDMPYTVGQVVEESIYNAMTESERAQRIDAIEFGSDYVEQTGTDNAGNPVYEAKHYYFCREPYTIGEKGEGYGGWENLGITDAKKTYKVGDQVIKHLLISEETYQKMPNLQAGFVIHGTAPQETSTFYVSREPDILDLQKEKIITVIYMYEYEESDESGQNITPVSERHIVNIHINFESGIPEIGPLNKPKVVLPGTTVGLKIPNVEPGAFEITGSGWEIFDNEEDAIHHRNGKEYRNNETPMYWYQNGYYVAYYAQSYLGKTYSNAVPFTVANYHDLKKVMEAKTHHYYIDHADVKRAPKIYINDYSHDAEGSKNGLDLFRQLYDLSVLGSPTVNAETGLISGGTFDGHAPLSSSVAAGENLEFILRADLSAPTGTWTPIGSGTNPCFAGTLHGDGHTISGLSNSLFGNLCGDVYNLGVTGSFTDAGVANTGEGYVENCWIKSSATSGFSGNPVFGNPTRTDGSIQLVNSYYPESNSYSTTNSTGGNAIQMADEAFYNGTVTYNLNGFYLNKRYYDGKSLSEGTAYNYWKANADGSLSAEVSTGYYPAVADAKYGYSGYVEERYKYPDFIYAGGTIPDDDDQRLLSDATNYAPIWPDDYLFFGQMLTYGFGSLQSHQPLPSAITKGSGRLPLTSQSNRVYRAPAYFQSKQMGVAHFNPWANLAERSKDGTHEAYPGMTAIDFTGYGDKSYTQGGSGAQFYTPILDNDGLTGIANRNLTKNLLVYIPEDGATGADGMTRDVVNEYASDPDYADFYADNNYRTVAENNTAVNSHVVERTAAGATTYQSVYDHFLVDCQDFNAPIGYTFVKGKRMWYQRKPDRYVDLANGWETVSLPFTAELVTTQDKGEITHFYSGSRTAEGSDAKIGHEYWLRKYAGKTLKENSDPAVYVAAFNYPDAAGEEKTVTNTFLWDYYYHKNYADEAAAGRDMNTDTYQTYYMDSRSYADYPWLAVATPYIIGFPGETYYEFDLSGTFRSENTAQPVPAQLSKQVITFASKPGISITVSDDELASSAVTEDGYTFMPNYMSQEVRGWHMNNAGNAFERQMSAETPAEPVAVATVPFRPYFVATTGGAPRLTRSIVFDSDGSQFAIGDERESQDDNVAESVDIRTVKRRVVVTSRLRHKADVRIFNAGGLCVATFDVEPGQTIEHPILHDGIYVVHVAGGRYRSKLAVR